MAEENKNIVPEEESDEFIIIENENETSSSDIKVAYELKNVSEVASTYGDEEVGLDQVHNSAAHSQCSSLLHSMTSLAPFVTEDPAQYEKFVEVVKGENEKNRIVLEQIASMVAQLTKEKHENSELRNKVEFYEKQNSSLQEELAGLKKNMQEQEELHEKKIRELNEALKKELADNARKEARTAEMSALMAEKDLRIFSLEKDVITKSQECAAAKFELEGVQKNIEKQQREIASQNEIIRMLQEELGESERMLTKSRQDYRDKIDEISAQWERNYRNESTSNPKSYMPNVLSRTPDMPTNIYQPSPPSAPSASEMYICDRCLNAFPTNGSYLSHRFKCILFN